MINVAILSSIRRWHFRDGVSIREIERRTGLGGPGTGKTHIATALGVQAIGHHRQRVRFFPTIELVNALEQEQACGRQGHIAMRLMHADLVILDELGYLPFSQAEGALRSI